MVRMLAAAVAIAALPMVAMAQTAVPETMIDGTLLDVVAEGQVNRAPDIATIRAGVVTQAPTAAAALSANATQMSRVLAAIKAAGVAPRDVQTSTISLNPQYRYGENQPPVITGYQASNNVSVKFRDIAKSGAILDALVKEGANQIDGPNLSIDQIEAAQDAARVDAIAKAKARAELYAKALGMRVERLIYVSEATDSAPGPMPVMMVRAQAAKDSTQIVPGEQQVSVNVRVRFMLK